MTGCIILLKARAHTHTQLSLEVADLQGGTALAVPTVTLGLLWYWEGFLLLFH